MDPRWNLTSVRIGEWDTTVDPDCDDRGCADPVQDNRIVLPPIVHPDYSKDSRHQHHDIALLRLAKRVKFNVFRKPICVSIDPDMNDRNYDGYSFDVTGMHVRNGIKMLNEFIELCFLKDGVRKKMARRALKNSRLRFKVAILMCAKKLLQLKVEL